MSEGNKKRIIWHSVAPWIRSGYGKITNQVVSGLQEHGFEVIISCYYGTEPGGILEWNNMKILSSKEGPFGIHSAAKYSRQLGAHMSILFTDWWAFSEFPKIMPNPILYGPMDHVNYCEEIYNFTRMYWKLIGLCKWQKDNLAKVGIPSDYIYHGVDTRKYRPLNKKDCRKMFNIEEDKFVFGTVAANSDKEDRKAHSRSMKAMRYFLDQNPDVKEKDIVWIYHSPPIDPRGMPLSSICHKLKLDNVIKFMDPSIADLMISEEQLITLMNCFDVHILCSKREGFGLPIIETQACGVPNISHDFSSMTELVQGHGWLAKSLGTELNLETTPINGETAMPDVYSIASCIKDAYFDDKKREGWANKSREFALNFDSHLLIEKEWVPKLNSYFDEIKPKSLEERKLL